MFRIERAEDGRVALTGRLDAAQADTARSFLDAVRGSCTVDFAALDYISSAGLGVLLAAQKRLRDAGGRMTLVNLNAHIRDLFAIAGFDRVFEIK